MLKAAIFDIDGTLVDSVDLRARAWQEAFAHFGHEVTFEQARSQNRQGRRQADSGVSLGRRAAGPWRSAREMAR